MNFAQAINEVIPKLAFCSTEEEYAALLRPLLVKAYRDGRRFEKRQLQVTLFTPVSVPAPAPVPVPYQPPVSQPWQLPIVTCSALSEADNVSHL